MPLGFQVSLRQAWSGRYFYTSIHTRKKYDFDLLDSFGCCLFVLYLIALAQALSKKGPRTSDDGAILPRVVMLSSAGVTRPGWSEEKKKALEGSAGIPIVRLNPFGILGVKEESEKELRRSGEFHQGSQVH